jgi:V/A-type H+-transporting ATPase subunit E
MEEKVEKIIQRIEEDSRAEVEGILREARDKAEKIKAEAEKKAKGIEDEIIGKGKREAEQEKQRIIANARLRARKMKLDAKEEVIRAALEEAEKKLKKVSTSKDYPKVLENLIEEAAISIGEKEVKIFVRKEDARILTADLLEKLSKEAKCKISLSSQTINTCGGVIARTNDGRVEVDNTLETRMERMREDLRSQVAEVLLLGGRAA